MCAYEGYGLGAHDIIHDFQLQDFGYGLGAHDIIHDFQLQDFIDDENFDQFLNLIRGENEDAEAQFDIDLITGSCFNNDQLFITPTIDPVGLFGFDHNATNQFDQTSFPTSLTSVPSFGKQSNDNQDHDDDEDEDEDSCGTTPTTNTTTTPTNKPKADRSRTLVSEKKRRRRMKDKLYALRALVPNITKMDKASIIGDAVLYMQDLQKQAKKLKGEILSLEASLEGPKGNRGLTQNPTKNIIVANTYHSPIKQIFQIDVSQVEEKGFHVKVGCSRGAGVATSIYKAIESLASFNVQSSNLDMVDSNRLELTLILKVKDCEQEITNLTNLRFWVAGAFLNQGFELATDVV